MKRLHAPHDSEATPVATTRLGDWVATLITYDQRPCVLAASQLSLLPLLIPLAPAKMFVYRFPDAVEEMLNRLAIPDDRIAEEREAMNICMVERATTSDRVVLGSLNDFQRMAPHYQEPSLIQVALKLAEAPCSPIKMERPRDVARALFALPR